MASSDDFRSERQKEKDEEMKRARRRKELKAKIETVKGKIKSAQRLQEEFAEMKDRCDSIKEQWREAQTQCYKSEIAGAVTLTDINENLVADYLAEELSTVTSRMNIYLNRVDSLYSSTDKQISDIGNYIRELKREKSELEAQLRAV